MLKGLPRGSGKQGIVDVSVVAEEVDVVACDLTVCDGDARKIGRRVFSYHRRGLLKHSRGRAFEHLPLE